MTYSYLIPSEECLIDSSFVDDKLVQRRVKDLCPVDLSKLSDKIDKKRQLIAKSIVVGQKPIFITDRKIEAALTL